MGVYLSSPKTDKNSKDGGNGKLGFGSCSMQGWRSTMEDAHAALPNLDSCTSYFGVYDGHGGKVVAKFCAKHLHKQMIMNKAYPSGDLGTSIKMAFFRMDEMMIGQRGWRELAVLGNKINKFSCKIEGLIYTPRCGASQNQTDEWASEDGPHADFSGPTSGCTACVAIIRNNQLIVANAGDSRCVMSRKGKAYSLSTDHKPEQELERERIVKAGGFVRAGRINGRLNLSRAIGDKDFKQNKLLPPEKQIITANPDINIIDLSEDDEFVVLACDGIWECMTSQQLVDFVQQYINIESRLSVVCERVLEKCLAPSLFFGQGTDNMTMILVRLNKPTNNNTDVDQGSSVKGKARRQSTQSIN